jgi:hypothetical protein
MLEKMPRIHDDIVYRHIMDYIFINNPYSSLIPIWEIQNLRMFSEQFEIAALFGKCREIMHSALYESGLKRRLGEIFDLSRDSMLGRWDTVVSVPNALTPGRLKRKIRVRRERFNREPQGNGRMLGRAPRVRLAGESIATGAQQSRNDSGASSGNKSQP